MSPALGIVVEVFTRFSVCVMNEQVNEYIHEC